MRRVAILGSTDGWKKAPDDWEWWGMNTGWRIQPIDQFTRWFDLHPFADMYENLERDDEQIGWLRYDRPLPLVTLQQNIDDYGLTNVSVLPVDELIDQFGSYFTNSVAWMLGYAVAQRVDEIGIWGIDMAQEHEFRRERPSIEYLIGWARGAGTPVTIPDDSSLLNDPYLYGVEQIQDMAPVLRRRAAEYRRREKESRDRANGYGGAAEEAENLAMLWSKSLDS